MNIQFTLCTYVIFHKDDVQTNLNQCFYHKHVRELFMLGHTLQSKTRQDKAMRRIASTRKERRVSFVFQKNSTCYIIIFHG